MRDGWAAGGAVGCGLAIVLLAAAWRVLQARLALDSGGLTDYRAVWTVPVRWQDAAGFGVSGPAGPWGGLCVRVIQTAGKPADLLAIGGYLLLPSRSGYHEVRRMIWALAELRPGHRR